jgi:endonuclease YncB( thermonuclease family)
MLVRMGRRRRKHVGARRVGGRGVAPPLTVAAFLRRRKRRAWWIATVIVAVTAAAFLADRHGLLLHAGDDLARYDGRWFAVARVVDGDTIHVAAPDGRFSTTRVRLWGIDAPELGRADLGRPAEPLAEQAAARVAELTGAGRVRLHLEPHSTRDRFGRLLAYVELPDGVILNEVLLLEGLALAVDAWPHRDVERYALLEEQARKSRVGRWAP